MRDAIVRLNGIRMYLDIRSQETKDEKALAIEAEEETANQA